MARSRSDSATLSVPASEATALEQSAPSPAASDQSTVVTALTAAIEKCLPFVEMVASRGFEYQISRHLVHPAMREFYDQIDPARTTLDSVRTILSDAGLEMPAVPPLIPEIDPAAARAMSRNG